MGMRHRHVSSAGRVKDIIPGSYTSYFFMVCYVFLWPNVLYLSGDLTWRSTASDFSLGGAATAAIEPDTGLTQGAATTIAATVRTLGTPASSTGFGKLILPNRFL